jgi:hypothetical protein
MDVEYWITIAAVGLPIAFFGDIPLRPLTSRDHPIARVIGPVSLALFFSSLAGWCWFGEQNDKRMLTLVVIYWVARSIRVAVMGSKTSGDAE